MTHERDKRYLLGVVSVLLLACAVVLTGCRTDTDTKKPQGAAGKPADAAKQSSKGTKADGPEKPAPPAEEAAKAVPADDPAAVAALDEAGKVEKDKN
ncbi:MAG: hypothetical protein MUF48_24970, partial [Pirellulaceae bacterium]|nr:hypothetical protein [Pirellulaceae bacterium]